MKADFFYHLKQHEHESDSKFYERFKNSKKVWSEVQAIEFEHSQGLLEKVPE